MLEKYYLCTDFFIFILNSLLIFIHMNKTFWNGRTVLHFKRFSRKGYAVFASLGREVLIGTLSVATLSHAKADGISIRLIGDSVAVQLADDKEVVLDEVEVTSGIAPMTLLQSAKLVAVITREDIRRAAAESINDLLKQAIGVDVRQRGGFGVQTDISINGGTFDQMTILLNGINISNPQTGHNAADFPVAMDDIERIEILEGAAARVYGSSAFNGAVNIVTRSDESSNVRLTARGGSFGTFGMDVGTTFKCKNWGNQVSGGYMQTDGGMPNSDFKKRKLFYQGNWSNAFASLDWQAGVSSQDFGANTFYSAKFEHQYEETRRYITSVNAKVAVPHTRLTILPSLYWHRDYDHYQLIRGTAGAAAGENYHRNDVFGVSFNGYYTWTLGKTAIGADVRRERILSTALGEMMAQEHWRDIPKTDRKYQRRGERTNNSLFLEHNFILDKLTLSMGLLANQNTGLDGKFRLYPGIDLSCRPNPNWKLCASWNKALRMPTYTDLYTNNSVQQGDLRLLPERTEMLKISAQFRHKGLAATLNTFYSKGTNMIDWVYETETSSKYHALNIGKLDNMGFSVDASWRPAPMLGERFFITNLKLGYAFIHQRHETSQPIFKSLYALEYLRHKVIAQLDHRIWRHLSASWSFRWQQRMNGFHPYAKIDAKIVWTGRQYKFWVQADNLTNHHYYDVGAVRQPGLWLMAGASCRLNL